MTSLIERARRGIAAAEAAAAVLQEARQAREHEAAADDPLEALSRFVLTDEQVEKMEATRMIWRDVIAHQHLIGWVAPANGGKTTLARQAAADLAPSFRVMYFQEDASAGDLPALHEHAKTHGYQLLNSTMAGGSTEQQLALLRQLSGTSTDLSSVVMVFDTLKKFADLMSKGGTREIFKLWRALTIRGATILFLGHTNKHRGPDGKLMFEGVGDVRNDVDDLFYVEAGDKDAQGVVTLTIKQDKVRCKARDISFRLDTASMQLEQLPQAVDIAAQVAEQRQRDEDASLIEAIRSVLGSGGMPYSELLKRVVLDTGEGRNAVSKVIQRYLGTHRDDARAIWLETRIRMNNTRYVSLKP